MSTHRRFTQSLHKSLWIEYKSIKEKFDFEVFNQDK